ncbi:putative family 12 glycoside hydrolase protein [Eutypa lata UCREL1]|uniref:Putative family 12 glycoside hydrolase protein n=1 Tax=Eutypa lata (strain UCR-EL1) TaxID=1287681 RepID=M7SQH6_EUTLA|nr:putative family 12 glycoside hydrolase protein [Eutypa lata UCREL1]
MLVLTFLLCTLNPLVAHALPNAKEGTASCKVKTATVTHTVFLDPTTHGLHQPDRNDLFVSGFEPSKQANGIGAGATVIRVANGALRCDVNCRLEHQDSDVNREQEASILHIHHRRVQQHHLYLHIHTGILLSRIPQRPNERRDGDSVEPGGDVDMSGQQCTNYEEVVETSGGTQQMVRYESVTDIEQVDDTEDVCKGYSNVGIGENLRKPFRDVKAIPAYFQWERTISTAFKGANVFDIITSPTSGDGSSTASSEFMLWISIWGGQVPIGYSRGPVATFDLYGTSFDLYEGENPGSGVTVRSALPTSSFDGVFEGDLRDWLQVMADRGYVADGDYVNVGNAGTEVFYGSSEMKAVVAIEIQV